MGKLSDAKLRSLINQGEPIAGLADGEGLYFTLSDAGTASWIYRYRISGRRRELTVGRYPDLSVAEARKVTLSHRAQVSQGIDVALEKRKKRNDAQRPSTTAALADEWHAREIAPKVKHPNVVERVIRVHIKPVLGSYPADEVSGRDIARLLDRIVDSGAPSVANDALRYMRRMFAFGIKREWLKFDPTTGFTLADAGGHEPPRKRALSQGEIAQLFAAMRESEGLGRSNELAFKLLLATCVRKGELTSARWAEFDLDGALWKLPKENTKTKRAISIPLAPAAIAWLRDLKVIAGDSEYVLPKRLVRGGKQRFGHVSPDTLNLALTRIEHGLEHFTIHDLRRTARTQLAALGVRSEVGERCLNHQLRGIEGTYNTHDFLSERREALEQWAELLLRLERGESEKVTPIRKRQVA